jgi:hypothetical protein
MSAFTVSPAVITREVDLSGVVPSVSTTVGAFAGVFRWGPIEDAQLISNEGQLVARYGKPVSANFETFFTAANFLAYSNSLYISRAASPNTYNAIVGTGPDIQIKNRDDYDDKESSIDSNTYFVAKWAGELGNSLTISVCDSAAAFNSQLVATGNNDLSLSFTVNQNTVVLEVENTDANAAAASIVANTIISSLQVGDVLESGNSSIGFQYLKITNIGSITTANNSALVNITTDRRYALSTNFSTSTVNRFWEYFNLVDSAPGTSAFADLAGGSGDELHVVVIDTLGKFTETRGQVLEVWPNLSRATDARGEQGGSLYYVDAINQSSQYVWFANHRPGLTVGAADTLAPLTTIPFTSTFAGGTDGVGEIGISLGDMARAYDKFKHGEEIDISLLLTGKSRFGLHGEGLANYLIDNVAEFRKDCVVFVSPERADVVQNPGNEDNDTVEFRRALRSSSYAFLDSGYKYQYDRYNDVFRWIPLNGDIAGTVVRTDDNRDPWFSPAGLNRGQIKNFVKLAWNPDKANRDVLYKNDINPVVSFPNLGTVLFGDKTLLGKPSAFDRINVRRLFIVLQKAISTASKFILFEFNDEFTRAQFRNLVEPYLRDVQGRRGITDFKVVCDTTNNTGEVIDRNEFIGDIYIKPARAVSFMLLSFVAVRTGIEFSEVVGRFG